MAWVCGESARRIIYCIYNSHMWDLKGQTPNSSACTCKLSGNRVMSQDSQPKTMQLGCGSIILKIKLPHPLENLMLHAEFHEAHARYSADAEEAAPTSAEAAQQPPRCPHGEDAELLASPWLQQ